VAWELHSAMTRKRRTPSACGSAPRRRPCRRAQRPGSAAPPWRRTGPVRRTPPNSAPRRCGALRVRPRGCVRDEQTTGRDGAARTQLWSGMTQVRSSSALYKHYSYCNKAVKSESVEAPGAQRAAALGVALPACFHADCIPTVCTVFDTNFLQLRGTPAAKPPASPPRA